MAALRTLRAKTVESLHRRRLRRFERQQHRDLGTALDYVNAIDLPRLSLADAVAGRSEGVFLPDDAWRQFKRYGPEFLDNPTRDDRFVCTDMTITYPPAFLVACPDALLLGLRTVVTPAGRVVNDDAVFPTEVPRYVRDLGNKADWHLNEGSGLVGDPSSQQLRLSDPDRPAIDISGKTIVLSSHEHMNLGSFLFRNLPKIYSMRRWGLEGYRIMAPRYASVTDEFLRMVGIDAGRIVEHKYDFRYRLEHLMMPSLRNNQAFLDPETIDLIGALRERFGRPQIAGKKIYVSRRKFSAAGKSTRVCLNEDALIERLASMGFDIFSPEEHTCRQQLEMFSSAAMVVGPSGAAMFNSVFCWPGTKLIDIESEPWWLHAHANIFSSSKLRYGIFVGQPEQDDPRTYHKHWRIDVDRLAERIRAFDAA